MGLVLAIEYDLLRGLRFERLVQMVQSGEWRQNSEAGSVWRRFLQRMGSAVVAEIAAREIDYSGLRWAVATYRGTAPSTLHWMFDKGLHLEELAGNPNTPTHLVMRLLKSMPLSCALNPRLPVEGQKELATHPNVSIRVCLAGGTHVCAEVINKLARDEAPEVRREVARNPATPTELLRELKCDEIPEVRRAAEGELERREQRTYWKIEAGTGREL